jgi:hypothetical protein
MTKEELQRALECAERCRDIDGMYWWGDVVDSLKAALEAKNEPVASMTVLHLKDRTEIGYSPASKGYDLPTGEYKLYTTPPPVAEPATVLEAAAIDPLPRACNLAGVDYQTYLKIKANMPDNHISQSQGSQGMSTPPDSTLWAATTASNAAQSALAAVPASPELQAEIEVLMLAASPNLREAAHCIKGEE